MRSKIIRNYIEKRFKGDQETKYWGCSSQIQLSNVDLISIKSNSVNTRSIKAGAEKIAKTRFIQIECVAAPLKKHLYIKSANFDWLNDLGHKQF